MHADDTVLIRKDIVEFHEILEELKSKLKKMHLSKTVYCLPLKRIKKNERGWHLLLTRQFADLTDWKKYIVARIPGYKGSRYVKL